jgi:hypothetical protein
MMKLLEVTTPRTHPVLAPYFFEMAPLEEKVWTADEARATFGYRAPREIWMEQQEAIAAGELKPYEQNHHEELLAFDTAGEHGGLVAN